MRRLALTTFPLLLTMLAAGCANTINEEDPHAPMRADGTTVDREKTSGSEKSAGKPDWAAVYETPRGTRYRDQTLIYVDRNSLQEHKLEQYTYYTATTREVHPSDSGARIQELAVLCEGAPIAPATSLRAEGSENRDGSYKLQRAKKPITSLSQFATQRIPIDAKVPSTFVVRAICLLGTDPHR